MQSPTPPTKPTPPTPPSMTTSTTTPDPSQYTAKPTAITPIKEQPAAVPNNISQSTVNVPPLGYYDTANSTSQETSSKAFIPPTTQPSKNNLSSFSFSTFFVLIFLIAIALVAVHWWKNYKPKQGSTVDYSTESSDEIVNLILSQSTPESVQQATPKKRPKKTSPTTEIMPKTKGNFEVRV